MRRLDGHGRASSLGGLILLSLLVAVSLYVFLVEYRSKLTLSAFVGNFSSVMPSPQRSLDMAVISGEVCFKPVWHAGRR